MSIKQDRAYTRTAEDLEQKYSFGKRFAEILGIATDARDKVDSVETSLRREITEQVTSITRDTEAIIMSALESYVETSDYETFKSTTQSELALMSDSLILKFETAAEQIQTVDGELQTTKEELSKHFEFTESGLTIKAGSGEMKLRLDNDTISFYLGDIDESDLMKNRFGWWDGVNFHTGNLYVDVEERAQFGNYAFVPRSNGSLSFLKVGG